MNIRLLLTFGLFGIVSLSHAQETSIPDISATTLSTISRELECDQTALPNGMLGCEILAQFSAANSPNPEVLKSSSGAGGKRWLGVTVISDKSSQPREAFQSSSPFQVLVVLGARYSNNFHKKLYFGNGYGYSYIWPTNMRQVAMIESAGNALLQGRLEQDNAVVPFARQADLQINSIRPSTGKSLLLGHPDLFLRQSGNNLYMIELGSSKEGDKFYLSRISLNTVIQ